MDRLDHCPNPTCGISLKGEPMDPKYFVHDLNSEEHKYSVEMSMKYFGTPKCFCLPYGERAPEDRFYRLEIGNEIPGVYDGVLFWSCPACGFAWHRFEAEGVNSPLRGRAERFVNSINRELV